MAIHLFCDCDLKQGTPRKELSLYGQVDSQGTVWVESQCNTIWHVCDTCTKPKEQNIRDLRLPQYHSIYCIHFMKICELYSMKNIIYWYLQKSTPLMMG